MVEKGILDPAKVTRSALQNATSVASTLLTTESVVATIKEDDPCNAGRRCRRNGYDVISVHHPVENRKRKWGAEMCRRFRTFLLYKYFRNKKCFSEAVISRS